MDRAIFGGSEILKTMFMLREVNTQTSSLDESHASFLFLFISRSTTEHFFLIRISLSFQLSELKQLKSSLHVPVDNSSVSGNSNQSFTFCLTVYPLEFPNDIGVLSVQVFALSNRSEIV
jgi:hypothetical protein